MTRLGLILATVLTMLALPAVASASPNATADFDGDGVADLAIGAPLDSVAGRENAGAVNVIYGSRRGGLREDPDQQFTQGSRGIKGGVEADDRFGASLAVGDFDNDGRDDLAVGTPDDSVDGHDGAGSLNVSTREPVALPPALARSGRRTARASRDWRPSSTASAPRWPPAISTATARTTSRSGSRAGRSAATSVPAPSR